LLSRAFPYFLRQVIGIAGFTANNIANGVVFRPYQGVFPHLTILQFYGTRLHVVSFVPVCKKSTELTSAQQHYTHMLHRISPKSDKRGKYGQKFVYTPE